MSEADCTMEDKQLNLNRPFLSVRRCFSQEDKRKANNCFPDRSQIPVYKSETVTGPLSNPGTVPFTWEKTPGRPKTEGKRPSKGQEQPPKLPPGKLQDSNKQVGCSSTNNLTLENEKSKDKTQEVTSKVDDDEAYFEAHDILSRSESFFFNCSISGLSGLDGLDSSLSGRFSTDLKVQGFMMGRFLPAAKAMASETPPHSLPKKQPVIVQEHPRVVKKSSNVNQQHPLYQYRPGGASPHYGSEALGIQREDDVEFEPKSSSMKVCGLLPQFLLKSSICILDPVQGIGMQEKPVSSVRRRKDRSSNTTTHGESGKKHGCDVGQVQLHPFRIETSVCAGSVPQEVNRVVGITETARGKGCVSFRELLANEGEEWKASNSGPVVERALYIDSVRHAESVSSDSNNTDGSVLIEPNGVDDNKVVKEAPFLDSLARDIKVINFVEPYEVSSSENTSKDSFDYGSLFGSNHHDAKDIGVVEDNNLCTPVDANLSHEDSRTSNDGFRSNQETDEKISSTREIERDTTEKEDNGKDNFMKFVVPPALPKSPSESWLFRTLPSVSSNKALRWSPMPQQNQIAKFPPSIDRIHS